MNLFALETKEQVINEIQLRRDEAIISFLKGARK